MKQEETLILRESDKGNQIQFIFNDLSNITSAEFRLIKPDETFVISAGEIDTENNIITFDINEQCCTVPGKGRFNIRLIGTDINVYTYVGRCIIDINLDMENAVESTAEANGYVFPDDFLTNADLSNYATKSYVDSAVENVPVYTPISYSLEEQNIGLKWVDGKPIYQKTVLPNLSLTTTWQSVIDLTDVDSLIDVKYNITRDGRQACGIFSPYDMASWYVQEGYLKFSNQGTSHASVLVLLDVTIQYTKTTDTV